MKKVVAGATSGYLFLTQMVGAILAQAPTGNIGVNVSPPGKGVSGSPGDLGIIISRVLIVVYGIALLIVLAFLIIGAFNWITSGGDKEKVKSARGQIISALVGVAILAFAVLITNVVARILNLGDVFNFIIPVLPTPAPTLPTPSP